MKTFKALIATLTAIGSLGAVASPSFAQTIGDGVAPGMGIGFQFYNLEVGRTYTVQINGQFFLTNAPQGVEVQGNEIRFVAPSEGSYGNGQYVSTSITVAGYLGPNLSVSTQLEDIAVWQVGGISQRAGGTIGVTGSAPPTCFYIGGGGTCRKDIYKGMLNFALYQGQFYCCLQSPY